MINNFTQTVQTYYKQGVQDERLVSRLLEEQYGGSTYPATKEEDMFKHVDFWWNHPNGDKIGIDVKGVKKAARSDNDTSDQINWIEMKNVHGNPGWIYGDSKYIAFRCFKCVLFIKTPILRKYAENAVQGKEITKIRPSEFYIPYQRKGRKDVIFKCPTSDLEYLAKHEGFIVNIDA